MFKWLFGQLALINELRVELAGERASRAYLAQRLAEMRLEHAKELAEANRRLSIAQTNFEWLSINFNRTEAERSQLMLGRLGITAPPMVVETAGATVPNSMTLDERRAAREIVDRGLADTARLNEIYGQGADGIAGAGGNIFDDVGDRVARAQQFSEGEVYDGSNPLLRN